MGLKTLRKWNFDFRISLRHWNALRHWNILMFDPTPLITSFLWGSRTRIERFGFCQTETSWKPNFTFLPNLYLRLEKNRPCAPLKIFHHLGWEGRSKDKARFIWKCINVSTKNESCKLDWIWQSIPVIIFCSNHRKLVKIVKCFYHWHRDHLTMYRSKYNQILPEPILKEDYFHNIFTVKKIVILLSEIW